MNVKYLISKISSRKKLVYLLTSIICISTMSPFVVNYYKENSSLKNVEYSDNSNNFINDSKLNQKENFKDVKAKDLKEVINSQSFIDKFTYKNNNNRTVLTNENFIINNSSNFNLLEFKEKVSENASNIVNGDLLISDLKKSIYEKLQDENIFNSLSTQTKSILMPSYENNLKNESENIISNNQNIAIVKNDSRFENINFSTKDLSFLVNIDTTINRLSSYANSIKNIAITSSILTAVSWGAVAFYCAAWFMFGANIPFIIAGTLQASTLTASTIISWNNYNDVMTNINLLKEIKNIITKEGILKLKKIILEYNYYNNVNSKITSIMVYLSQRTNVYKAVKFIFEQIFKKVAISFSKFGRNTAQIISNFLSKIAINRTIIISTLWASAIASIISIIDFSLSLADLCVSYLYLL